METHRTCVRCDENKPINEFGRQVKSLRGINIRCKPCAKIHNKEYYEANKVKVLAKNAEYRKEKAEEISAQRAEYRSRPEIKEHTKLKNKEHLPARKLRIKERRKTDYKFRLTEIIRCKYHRMIRGSSISYSETVGCDMETLQDWLEFQFDDNMTWENMGTYWEVDHILPINGFDFDETNIREQHICYNWSNLQPLFKKENRSKSDNLELHYYFNSIVNIHRFTQQFPELNGYQRINESLSWLREKTQVR